MTNVTKKENQTAEQAQPESEEWNKFAPTSSLKDDEPYTEPEISTELPLPARPLIKGGFAIALSGSVLVLIWVFLQMVSNFSWNKADQSPDEQQSVAQQQPTSEMTPEEKLQWCLATRKCGEGDKGDKGESNKSTKATTASKATSQPQKHGELAARSSTRPQTSNNYSPAPVQPIERPVQSVKPVQSSPAPIKQQEPRQQQVSDPIAQLAQASQLGSYTTVPNSSSSPTPFPSPTFPSRSTELVENRSLVDLGGGSTAISTRSAAANLQSVKVIPETTRIKAQVVTGFSWVGEKTDRKFRIQTTEEIKAEDGSILVPKGTDLLAQIASSNFSRRDVYDLTVQILSATINGQKKLIPADAIIVQGEDEEPLQAKVENRRKRGLGKVLITAGLAGISKGASANNSASIIIGNDTTRISGESNLGASVAQGAVDSLSQQISNSVSQNADNRALNVPVLELRKGTKLELIVNQPLSL